jgi:hypothetical protein
MEEEADLFEDAISVSSISSESAWKKGKKYISLSRCTVYHSAQDLHTEQSDNKENPMMATSHEPLESSRDNLESKVGTGVQECMFLP